MRYIHNKTQVIVDTVCVAAHTERTERLCIYLGSDGVHHAMPILMFEDEHTAKDIGAYFMNEIKKRQAEEDEKNPTRSIKPFIEASKKAAEEKNE